MKSSKLGRFSNICGNFKFKNSYESLSWKICESIPVLKNKHCIYTLKQAYHSCLLHGIRAVPTETNHFL